MNFSWILFYFILIFHVSSSNECEPIDLENECSKFLAYPDTNFPHLFHHTTQIMARERLRIFRRLIDSNCSNDAIFLFCSTFYPRCTTQNQSESTLVQFPCKNICESTRNHCSSQFRWPEFMQCNLYNTTQCMEKEKWQTAGTRAPLYPPKIKPIWWHNLTNGNSQ